MIDQAGLPTLAQTAPPPRRGAILLLVLSMLTLFLMIGTLMIVLATRARTTARAFADAVTGSGLHDVEARNLLEESLMVLVRGRPPGVAVLPATAALPVRESLLADRYSLDFEEGEIRKPEVNGPSPLSITPDGVILRATVTGVNPDDLPGRILTIKPRPSDPASLMSFRILSAAGTTNEATIELANLRTTEVRPLPVEFPCDVYVNGREFAGTDGHEAWDAFDGANAFMADIAHGNPVTVRRPSYGAGECTVDNDGDGVPDGVWLDDVLSDRPGGGQARVSYLVVDLGGRFNVNAHGSPNAGNAGSGPASVDGSAVIRNWGQLMNGGSSPNTAQPPGAQARRGIPALGGPLDGRFGGAAANTYAQRLDFDGPRFASRSNTAGNLFTCGELEWLLRPFDRDTTTLPARLAALLGDTVEDVRMLLTTDSWDTCGVTGTAVGLIAGQGDPATLPTDVAEGLRFNLDQPLDNDEEKQQFFDDLYAVIVAAGVPANQKTSQWVANVVEFLDADQAATQLTPIGGGAALQGVEPSTIEESQRDKLGTWDPGTVESAALLLGVPSDTKEELERKLRDNIPVESLAVEQPVILDVVTVASPFRATVFADVGGRTLCRWREPGRINVNTCDDEVWKAMVGSDIPRPFKTQPAQRPSDLLRKVPEVFSGPGLGSTVTRLNRGLANRLANIGTTRSDVFAVWITLEMTDQPGQEPHFHRLFAIVDRSIPVGHAPGQNLNARDTVRVLRHLE